MSAAVLNTFEYANRLRKAFRIACTLHRAGITPEQAMLQTQAEWVTTAACAGCKPPSEETREMVIDKLRMLAGSAGEWD